MHAGVCRDGRGRNAGLWGERAFGAARSGDREGGLSGANPVAWPRADEAPSMLVVDSTLALGKIDFTINAKGQHKVAADVRSKFTRCVLAHL